MPTELPPQSRSPEDGGEPTPDIVMHSDPRFIELKRRLLRFVFPMSIAFLVWYLTYVVMSAYARDVMATEVFGRINLALVFGLLQFFSTFGIAILYSRYAARRLDPLASELCEELTGGGEAGSKDSGNGTEARA
ncbi:DUF485 domain-containing protein [Streptomyces sp. XM4193]|uniref:DUF485 domain-containing protein n=1 Tax=Streptomyces sp. XM4193 TaxID=2929782 RepID=UPI001FF8EE78|nr:DUF485 domain-containing protein [Streptomyces sp. XM4193]MCK1796414.1 DUF485 domain-containing protein [Streptomyces sp. XM4193]